jgi:hypothetical protein
MTSRVQTRGSRSAFIRRNGCSRKPCFQTSSAVARAAGEMGSQRGIGLTAEGLFKTDVLEMAGRGWTFSDPISSYPAKRKIPWTALKRKDLNVMSHHQKVAASLP